MLDRARSHTDRFSGRFAQGGGKLRRQRLFEVLGGIGDISFADDRDGAIGAAGERSLAVAEVNALLQAAREGALPEVRGGAAVDGRNLPVSVAGTSPSAVGTVTSASSVKTRPPSLVICVPVGRSTASLVGLANVTVPRAGWPGTFCRPVTGMATLTVTFASCRVPGTVKAPPGGAEPLSGSLTAKMMSAVTGVRWPVRVTVACGTSNPAAARAMTRSRISDTSQGQRHRRLRGGSGQFHRPALARSAS